MTKQPDPLRDAGMRALRGWHMAAFDQRTGHDHPVEDCTDKRFIDTLDALHVTATPSPDHVWRTKTSIRDGSKTGRFVVDWEEAEAALHVTDTLDVERLRADIKSELTAITEPVGPFESGAAAAYHYVLARLTEADHE